MKKIIFLVTAFFLTCGILIGCSYGLNAKIKNNISENTNCVYVGDDELFFITLTCGQREEPYIKDGKSNSKQDFSVVCITFYQSCKEDKIACKLIVNDLTYSGEAEKNPFTQNYMFDFELKMDNLATVNFVISDKQISLICQSNNFQTSSEQAIDLAIENLNDILIERFDDGEFGAECYLKLINNPKQDKGIFFWYFSVQDEKGAVCTIIIDTMSSNVLAKY